MRALLLAGVVVFGLGAPARADVIAFGGSSLNVAQTLTLGFSNGQSRVLSTNNFQGWVSDTLLNQSGTVANSNYLVGITSGGDHNNFFDFSLSGVVGTVVSAALNLQSYTVIGNPIYSLFDVSTPTSQLSNVKGPNATIFADLGSGVSYGSFAVSPTYGTINSFVLNSAGLTDLNFAIANAVGSFNIGGTLNPIVAATAVPEPASLALLGAGLVGAGVIRRRRSD